MRYFLIKKINFDLFKNINEFKTYVLFINFMYLDIRKSIDKFVAIYFFNLNKKWKNLNILCPSNLLIIKIIKELIIQKIIDYNICIFLFFK